MTTTTETQRHYLAALGIDVYLRRAEPAIALAELGGRLATWMAVGQGSADDARFSGLFADLAMAVGAKTNLLRWQDSATLGAQSPRVLLNFGAVATTHLNAATELRLPEPAQLLGSAAAKRAAWLSLKPLLKTSPARPPTV